MMSLQKKYYYPFKASSLSDTSINIQFKMSNWIIVVTYHEVAGLGAGITMCWVRLIEICRLYVQLSMEIHKGKRELKIHR